MTFYSAFQYNAFWSGQFQINDTGTTPPVTTETAVPNVKIKLKDPYNNVRKDTVIDDIIERYKREERNLAQAETALIDVSQRTQEMQLEKMRLERLGQLERAAEFAAEIARFLKFIEIERQNIMKARNNMAFLVLIMADPFFSVGGVRTLH